MNREMVCRLLEHKDDHEEDSDLKLGNVHEDEDEDEDDGGAGPTTPPPLCGLSPRRLWHRHQKKMTIVTRLTIPSS